MREIWDHSSMLLSQGLVTGSAPAKRRTLCLSSVDSDLALSAILVKATSSLVLAGTTASMTVKDLTKAQIALSNGACNSRLDYSNNPKSIQRFIESFWMIKRIQCW